MKVSLDHHTWRTFLVGDVHGCNWKLLKPLDKIKFDPAVDKVFFAWDLVAKWPKSKEVLQTVRALWNSAMSVLWNKEIDLLCIALEAWVISQEHFARYKKLGNTIWSLIDGWYQASQHYWKWSNKIKGDTWEELCSMIIGFSPYIQARSTQNPELDFNLLHAGRTEKPLEDHEITDLTWNFWVINKDWFAWSKQKIRTFFGHTRILSVWVFPENNVVALDTWAYTSGWRLSAYELATWEVFSIKSKQK